MAAAEEQGSFEGRIIEVAKLAAPVRAFHPKSWRFEGDGVAVAFVGSSNVSHSALRTGIEWNLRVDRERDPAAYAAVAAAFERLWATATPLSAEWVSGYLERIQAEVATGLPPGEVEQEAPLGRPRGGTCDHQRSFSRSVIMVRIFLRKRERRWRVA